MKDFLSPAEARGVLGISPARLRHEDLDRRLQPVRIGRSRVYRIDSVAAELDRRIERAKKGNAR